MVNGPTSVSRRTVVGGVAMVAAGSALAGVSGCAGSGSGGAGSGSSPSSTKATLVFKNGHVQTLVAKDDVAQAVAIAGSEIAYVGDDAGVDSYIGDETKVIDLDGAFLCPGLMDGHLHGPQPYYEEMFQISIPAGCADNDEYLRIISEFIEKHPDDEVYYGGPFMQNAYLQPDGSNPGPQKSDLDAICSDKPIMIRDVSHHSYWVNSKALEIAGITADTPDPDGGSIARDENGEPSGLLTDSARDLVTAKIEVPYDVDNMKQAYEAFQEYCHSVGITGLTNINLSGVEQIHADALHAMDEAGELHLRQRFLVWGQPGDGYDGIKKKLDAVKQYDSEMFTTGTVKIVYDGVTEGATAVMLEPYLPAAGKGDAWYATSDWSDEELNRVVSELDANGYQVHIHAIGDGAVRTSVDAYEQARENNGERDARHTMVHVCAITDEDIKRVAELDVISCLQFLWMYYDSLCELEAAFIGEERALAMYPAKNMLEAGCFISGGSDGAVTAYDKRLELETGITRNSPFPEEEDTDMTRWVEQGLTAYQMLEIYTKNVAYENFMEDLIGTVEVGKKADLVVMDTNIIECDPKEISDATVLYTISNGDIVYEG